MIGSYLIDPTRSEHTLEDTALEHLGYKALTDEDVCGAGSRTPLWQQPPGKLCDFACERADLPLQLVPIVAARLDSEALTPVWETLERPLMPVLVAMEQAGVRVDTAILRTESERFERELDTLSRRIFDLAGVEFNIGSPKQLGEVLFEKLQLPTLKRTGKTRAI